MSDKETNIISRTQRMPQSLYNRISSEAIKSGNSINSEINSLVLDGIRFREATIVVQLKDR